MNSPGLTWNKLMECWTVSDPAMARLILNHPGFSSQTAARSHELYMTDMAREQYAELTEFLSLWFVHTDGPQHLKLRRPVQRLLSPSYVRSLGPQIEDYVDAALDELATQHPADFIPTVANQVPVQVISDVVGIEADPALVRRWSTDLSRFIAAMYRPDYAKAADITRREMSEWLATSSRVRSFPWETPEQRARSTATWATILFGGLETTFSLLGSVVLTALSSATTWASLQDEKSNAVTELVESVLESRPPLRNVGRIVAGDQEFAGEKMLAGDLVLIALSDSELFSQSAGGPAGSRCPVAEPSDERHLAFGAGSHYCPGASLARLEAATVLRRLAWRFPAARLSEHTAAWGANPAYISLEHLHIELGTERRS
ncbi:cytochrome P450 family protein [Streptomyces buecherae]|uniref:cytochrome P450 n=1 Tax=Streptomyces buecherae TaxID=2763006 RepID=UPI003667485E